MANLRFSRQCQWYVFETEERVLAVWHRDHRKKASCFNESDVREMVYTKEFSRIPGYSPEPLTQLCCALEEWLRDIEKNVI